MEVSIPEGVTSIGEYAFSYNNGLASVSIPSTAATIGDGAFRSCPALKQVINNRTTPQPTSAYPLSDNRIIDLYVPEGSVAAYSSAMNWSDFRNKTAIGSSPYPKTWSSGSRTTATLAADGTMTISGTGAMANFDESTPWNSYLSSIAVVVINVGVTSIRVIVFQRCTALTQVSIPSGVTTIGFYAFNNCTSLASVTIPNSLTSIYQQAFSKTALTSVSIPSSVTEITIAFTGCTALTAINVDAANANFTSVDGVLFNKDTTRLYTYPAGKTAASYTIPNIVTRISSSAFSYCTSLASVTIPASVTDIRNEAFRACTALTEVYNYATTPPAVHSTRAADVWKDFKSIQALPSVAVRGVTLSGCPTSALTVGGASATLTNMG